MTLKLPDIVIDTLIKALNDEILIQKQARLCDLAALDFIPTEILPHLKLHHQKAIAKSPITPQRIFEKLSHLVPKNYRAFNDFNNPEYLRKLAQSKDWRERIRVAENPNTPIDVLQILANDPFGDMCRSPLIRKAVAENKAAPIEILEHLAKDSCKSVRSGVASNPSTPIYLLESLATNVYGVPVFYALARNPLIPSRLLVDIAELTTDIMILELIAKHPNTPSETLLGLLKHAKENNYWLNRIKVAIASNVSTPASILKNLYAESIQSATDVSQDSYSREYATRQLIEIRAAIARNSSTPICLLRELILQTDISILAELAKNPNLPCDLQETLVYKHSNLARVQSSLAWNPNTSFHIFKNIPGVQNVLKNENVRVRYRLTRRPQGLSLLLDRCLKPERCLPEQNSLNRVLAGMHPAISQQQIDNLFYSDNWLDRLSVACNSKCRKEYLLQLTQDKNDVVEQAARELLKEKDLR